VERGAVVTSLPLRIGGLSVPGFTVRRSGIRWLREDGHACRPSEVVAYCNIGLVPIGRAPSASDPFAAERRDFQVAFAPRVAGRLRKAADSTQGGLVDRLPIHTAWTPDTVIGHVEAASGSAGEWLDGELRLLFLAGRRVTELAGVPGLLTGWHQRSRAWWADRDGGFGTVLSLGNCEQDGVIRGEQDAYLELFEAVEGPAHVVHMSDDHAIVPCSAVVLEGFRRTRTQFQEIGEDLRRTFPASQSAPGPADWMYAGLLLLALEKSPLSDRYDLLGRTGLERSGPPDAVILSLGAEHPFLLRHRRLGYALNCHRFRLLEAGQAFQAWLKSNFELVKRTPDQIRQDYRELIDAARARHATQFIILNLLSTLVDEEISSYAAFDAPMRDTLSSVRAKELNLMLHDLARERDVSIIDVDAIAADLGSWTHVPDGTHHSGTMQAEIRGEILRVLRARGVPGFGAR
jgi:hypothetical protein